MSVCGVSACPMSSEAAELRVSVQKEVPPDCPANILGSDFMRMCSGNVDV
jgi:hypothetical protein